MKEIKTWSLAFTYVGCFLGAGFISGQELWQFFGSFGNLGYVGFLLAVVLFSAIGQPAAGPDFLQQFCVLIQGRQQRPRDIDGLRKDGGR